jgi:hypothetical protein
MRKLALPLVVSLLVLAVLACSSGTPVPAAPAVAPTYPPQPTYTPYPTQVPPQPTAVPQVQAQSYDSTGEYKCATTDLPSGTTSKRCFDVTSDVLGVLYFQNGRLIAVATLFPYTSSSTDPSLQASVDFTYKQAMLAGWSHSDWMGLANLMATNASGTASEVYGSLTSSVKVNSDNSVIVIIGLTSFFNSDVSPVPAGEGASA